MRLRPFASLLLFFLAFAVIPYAHGARDWYVRTNGLDTAATDWDSAYTNIQRAISEAGNGDTIYLAGQTFPLTNQLVWEYKEGITIRGGYAATNNAETPGAPDLQQWPTVLAGTGSYRILYANRTTNSVLDGVTLSGGYANALSGGGAYIYSNANFKIYNSTIKDNRMAGASSLYGAGLYAVDSSLTISNTVIRNNDYTRVAPGSSHYGGGMAFLRGSATLRDSIVIGNKLYGNHAYGAGIYINAATVNMLNMLIVNNDSASYTTGTIQGDGVFVEGAGSVVDIANSTLAGNCGEGVRRTAGTVRVLDSILWKNITDLVGVSLGVVSNCNTEMGVNLTSNGCFSTDPQWERGYYLASGSTSRDTGSKTVGDAGLTGYTTHADGTLDTGTVDVGYHYAAGLDMQYADLYVSAQGGNDTWSGADWGNPLRTITRAAALARDGTRIHLASGSYTNGAETFPIVISHIGSQLLGTNRAETVISAAGGTTRVMELDFGGGDSRIESLTLKSGSGTTTASYGGGLYTRQAMATVSDCYVYSNRLGVGGMIGGGVWARASFLTISNCVVEQNWANNYSGGLIARGGGLFIDGGEVLLRDTVVSANKAHSSGSSWGGGVFIGNSPLSGNAHYSGHGRHQLINCLIEGNLLGVTGANGHGAGVYIEAGGVSIANCTVGNNSVDEGIKRGGGTVSVLDSILWGNNDDISGTISLTNNCIQDGDRLGFDGNINSNPQWTGGYRLTVGSSLCIDAGSKSSAAAGLDSGYTTSLTETPDTGIVDLGYHYSVVAGEVPVLDVYVSGIGFDTNSGTNEAYPLRSITKALTKAADGATIHIATGMYTNGVETFPLSFSKQGIQLIGTNRAATVINAAGANQRVMSIINGGSGCRVEGLTIRGAGGAFAGGGIYANGSGLSVIDCTISNNVMSLVGGSPGGGIYASACNLVVSNSVIAGNWAYNWSGGNKAYGGGIYAINGSALITHSMIYANSAAGSGGGYGGGVALENVTATIRNTLLHHNSATLNHYGDGIYIDGGNVTIENATIADNAGEGIRRINGTVTVTNSILWANGDDIYGTMTLGYNDIEDGDQVGVNGNLSDNPLFMNASTNDYRLAKGSPVANKGITLSWMTTDTTDLYGNPRVQGGKVDMGAHESDTNPGSLFIFR